jgi:hypothetical protein
MNITRTASKLSQSQNWMPIRGQSSVPIDTLSMPTVAIAAPTDPQARFKMHLEGLKQAMEEIDPTIKRWSDYGCEPASPQLKCRFALMAYNYDPKELS